MRYFVVAASLLLSPIALAETHISVGISTPGLSIGFNMPMYPDLVLVPGTPVYYDPRASANYFFYDGLYWVYQDDDWYASSWYNGPWGYVSPEDMPVFVLRVPVRYYRQAPTYFRGWRDDAPPQWGEHWGQDWRQRHGGWDRWDRNSVPQAAPLPTYQRTYSDDRYPRAAEQQREIQSQNYRYQPRERVVLQSERPAHAMTGKRLAEQQDRPVQQAQPEQQGRPVQQRQPEQQNRAEQQRQPERQKSDQRAQSKKNQDHGRGPGDHRDEGKRDDH